MIDVATIEAKDIERAELADLMAAFEAQNGPVQTSPIQIGAKPAPGFTIHTPGKPKPDRTPVVRKTAAERKPRPNMVAKNRRVAELQPMALKGATIAEMAEASGYTRKYIANLLYNRKLLRGPKTDLTKAP